MRALAITQNITLDGRVEMLDDWFDPTAQPPDLLAELHRQDATCDAVLLGRRTFEDFRGYWPEQREDATGITDQLDAVTKYVVSATLAEPGWRNSVVLRDDPMAAVAALKTQPGGDIVATGSISLCHALIGAGLVDEYRLFVHPAVQGRGRGLFPDGHAVPRLELLGALTFANGVIGTRHRPR
ncbi:dihydrofolate reductase [Tsukamurella pulmonis]|uniref:Dihydrofolate reductase n=1 Tax=Tsukamurella pulmonis TaxID=47312 RepID=A0A1H1C9S7_9ACTN|nr:dihydrofolate reductase family protein [Tsukamurella pulmonis]KXO89996.1 dihydrofolate reductase [Tsukamurella pulmonis]SDQ60967.1 Dihydrofolate reductase [Tsukamurella pulmonis]SUP24002.1 RibD C-terminal domain [Tsukamurella pulmonis]